MRYKPRPVMFDPIRGVVVPQQPARMDGLPVASRNWLNSSYPGPSMREYEADICNRQIGDITLLRDQTRSIDRSVYPTPENYIRDNYASQSHLPFIGVVLTDDEV